MQPAYDYHTPSEFERGKEEYQDPFERYHRVIAEHRLVSDEPGLP